jgi:hypothetical protein
MKILSFELTMPNIGSWNGKWTGSDKKYFVIRKMKDKFADEIMKDAKAEPVYEGILVREKIGYTKPRKNYYYNFGDGWGANVCIEQVDAKEAAKRRKISSGFCGYEWMIDSIIIHGDIRIVNTNH